RELHYVLSTILGNEQKVCKENERNNKTATGLPEPGISIVDYRHEDKLAVRSHPVMDPCRCNVAVPSRRRLGKKPSGAMPIVLDLLIFAIYYWRGLQSYQALLAMDLRCPSSPGHQVPFAKLLEVFQNERARVVDGTGGHTVRGALSADKRTGC